MPGARIDRIRQYADQYLAEVEAEGCTTFFAPTSAIAFRSVDRIYRDLAVEAGDVVKWKPPGRIGIALPAAKGGLVSAEAVEVAIRAVAGQADNRRKLSDTRAPERHLFVLVTRDEFLAWVALIDEPPPSRALVLPDEITDVWAAGEVREGGHFVVWRADRSGWTSLGVLQVDAGL